MKHLLTFDALVALGYVANRVTLARRIKRGEFPAPIRVGRRNIAWLKSEIDAWEAARIAERNSDGGFVHPPPPARSAGRSGQHGS